MLDSKALRDTLKKIFNVEDKYLVPLNSDWFIPTTDPNDKTGTWIGYRILNKKAYARAYQSGVYYVRPFKIRIRLSFVGPQAEHLADQTMFWEDRTDVQETFEKRQAQINYQDRISFTYPIRNGGYNDEMCWVTDLSAQTSYEVETKQRPWFSKN